MRSIRRLWSELAGLRRTVGWRCAARFALEIARNQRAIRARKTLAPADVAMELRDWQLRLHGATVEFENAAWAPAGGAVFGQVRELYGREIYFGGPQFTVRSGDTVLDLGANAGLFSVLAARLGGRVVAVDAVPNPRFPRLVKRNQVEDRITYVLGRLGASTDIRTYGATLAPPITMEEIFAKHSLEKVDFLKCDIEGAEFEIFDRRAAWLTQVRRMAVEIHPLQGDRKALARELELAGFHTTMTHSSDVRGAPDSFYLYAWR